MQHAQPAKASLGDGQHSWFKGRGIKRWRGRKALTSTPHSQDDEGQRPGQGVNLPPMPPALHISTVLGEP